MRGQSAVKRKGTASVPLITARVTVPALLVLAGILALPIFENYTTIAVLIATLIGLLAAGLKRGP